MSAAGVRVRPRPGRAARAALPLLAVGAQAWAQPPAPHARPATSDPPRSLAEHVRAARGADVPAIGAVVVSCRGAAETAVAGVTRVGGTEPVAAAARFNVGSNAKSMLASLAAVYVQEGRLRWATTVAEVLGPAVPGLDPALGRATLAQLLSHRAGLRAYDTGAALDSVTVTGATPSARRLAFAARVLREAAAYPPGSRFVYSNAGYVVAGVMLERVGGRPFEALMRERLFRPLGIAPAFGTRVPPADGDPWGHVARGGTVTAYADTAPIIPDFLQPAGDVSLSLAEYGAYLREHLCGLAGAPTRVLRAETVRDLHAPQGPDGAGLGWGQFELAGTPASVHVGGTGAFSAFVAVLPRRDRAVATVTSSGDGRAALALLQALVAEGAAPGGPPR